MGFLDKMMQKRYDQKLEKKIKQARELMERKKYGEAHRLLEECLDAMEKDVTIDIEEDPRFDEAITLRADCEVKQECTGMRPPKPAAAPAPKAEPKPAPEPVPEPEKEDSWAGLRRQWAEEEEQFHQTLKAAEQGCVESQYSVGEFYLLGTGVHSDDAKAAKWFRKAAEQGHAEAQFQLGLRYRKGQGVPQSDEEGLKWYRLAAEQGHDDAKRYVEVIARRSEKQAEPAYPAATKAESKPAPKPEPQKKPMTAFEATQQGQIRAYFAKAEAAKQPDPEPAQIADDAFNAGVAAYEQGNYTAAVNCFRTAAEQGHARAQFNLGLMYDNGRGVTEDKAEAVKWLRAAAEQGYEDAQLSLALSCETSEGAAQAKAEVQKQPAPAPKTESKPTQTVETAEDDLDAMDEVLAMSGDSDAAERVGLFYYKKYKRTGAKDDLQNAYEFFNAAMISGSALAVGMLMEEDFKEYRESGKEKAESTKEDQTITRNFNRSQTSFKIGTIGWTDHKGPALSETIANTVHHFFGTGERYTVHNGESILKEKNGEVTFNAVITNYETDSRQYTHIDCLNSGDCVKYLISGELQMDGAVLVVDALAGTTSQISEHLRLANQTGVNYIVVFVDNCNLVAQEEQLEQLDYEIQELLDTFEYPGEDTPIIHGSARKALENAASEWGYQILELIEAIDAYMPDPEEAADKSFVMPVEDAFTITGRGTVLTGKIESGVVKPNSKLEIVGFSEEKRLVTVTGLEMYRKLLDSAEAGMEVGILLRGVHKSETGKGYVLMTPGTGESSSRFTALVHLLDREGVASTKVFANGNEAHFRIRTADVLGTCEPQEWDENGCIEANVELSQPVAINKGLKFSVCDADEKTIGYGIITAML